MIAVLAGGVGAAKFLQGLVRVVPESDLVVIGNTGDDAVIHGLHISPDLDTVTYALAGASNPETGWGIAGDSFRTMDALDRYGAATWFRLGDLDIATHLYRSERLASGATLSQVTAEIVRAWGVGFSLLPMSDDPVRTVITLQSGDVVDFQEYFVHRRHSEPVRTVDFSGLSNAGAAPGVIEALEGAEAILLAPSNPVLSLGPILAVAGVDETLRNRRSDVVAISPIVAGHALKGPADHLLEELGHEASALGVARLLAPVAGNFVLDVEDASLESSITSLDMHSLITETVMGTPKIATQLAQRTLEFARKT
ncbi:MAG: 2-phospho-L-lactate transferase [Acidimicrobiales bacterium]